MNYRVCFLALTAISSAASAGEYQSFTEGRFSRSESVYRGFTYYDPELNGPVSGDYEIEADQYLLRSTYYFSERTSEGPYREFEYINLIDNIYGEYSRQDRSSSEFDAGTIGGEYFAGNVKLGGSYGSINDTDVYTATLGYLFSPDLLVSIDSFTVGGGGTTLFLNTRYNYQINGTDYFGVNVRADDEFSSPSLSAKYFSHLGSERYLSLTMGVLDREDSGESWNVGANYYFNKSTSLGISAADGEDYGVNLSHFFNKNIALDLSYNQSRPEQNYPETDVYSIGLTAQF